MNTGSSKMTGITSGNTEIIGIQPVHDLVVLHPVLTIMICLGIFMLILGSMLIIMLQHNRNNRRIHELLFVDMLTGAWNINRLRSEWGKLTGRARAGESFLHQILSLFLKEMIL